MIGAILGDIIGSRFEIHNVKTENFELFSRESSFTDDSIMTVAVCDELLYNATTPKNFFSCLKKSKEYAMRYKQYYRRYPNAGFGEMFKKWALSDALFHQHSFANGGAMRVCPIAYAYDELETVQRETKISCVYTHYHAEAIKGAQAVSSAVFLAKIGESKEAIKNYIEKKYKYKLDFTLDSIRSTYVFDSKASYSVPPAIVAFLESDDYESAIRKAISIGGDSDTIACIAGGIAEAFYKDIPKDIYDKGWMILDSGLKKTVKEFRETFIK
jgi:ADP-ribosylglycohydrolase